MDIRSKFAIIEVPIEDVGEDSVKRLFFKGLHVEEIEMAHKSVGDSVSSLGRGAHRNHEGDIAEMNEFFFLGIEIIPSSIVKPLSEKLNRGLAPILLFDWHVHVVNENNDIFSAFFWAKVIFLLFGIHL